MAIAQTPSDPRQAAPASPEPGRLRLLRDLEAAWAVWRERRAYRSDLKRLLQAGPHLIADIGLTQEAARREAGKPFWKD